MALTSSSVLTDFDFGTVSNRRGPQRHDWDQLLDGNVRQIEAAAFGEKGAPKSFAGQASSVAKKRGLKLRLRKLQNGNIVLQAYKEEPASNTPANDGSGPRVGPDNSVAVGAPESQPAEQSETHRNHKRGKRGEPVS